MKPLRVIIVEDSEDDMLLLLLELKKGGYKPTHIRIETAEELSAALIDRTWDLVISDHALPSFSAPKALDILNASGKALPFIIVSSIIGEEVAVAAMKAGAHDYIMKNNLVRLVPVIERALIDAEVRAEREKAKEALQESEARFRRLADNALDLIYRVNLLPDRCFEYISPSATAITGYTPEDHYDNPALIFDIVHPDDRHLLEAVVRGDIQFEQPLVVRWICKDGSLIWVEQRNVPVYNDEGNLASLEGIARDITDRILYEKKLANNHAQIEALTSRILSAMEEERARLARELHDELGQSLTAVKLDLQLLGEEFTLDNNQSNRLKQSIDLVDYTINLVRRQSVSLRPPALDDMGLLPAIDEMVRGFMSRTGVTARIEDSGFSKRLPGHVETALYRCVQESLTNVARHAKAQKVTIKFKKDNGCLSIIIADDGVGFEPDKIEISADHIGLTGMQERVKLLSGDLVIESAPGQGTRVIVSVPCRDLIGEEATL